MIRSAAIAALAAVMTAFATPASGQTLGSQITVNTFTSGEQSHPAVGVDGQGRTVVVWQSWVQDGSGWGVYARRFDDDMTPLGGEIPVNVTTEGSQAVPTVSVNFDGDFAVAWVADVLDSVDVGNVVTTFRMFDETGAAVGAEESVCGMYSELALARPGAVLSDTGRLRVSSVYTGLAFVQGIIESRAYDVFGEACSGNCQASSTPRYAVGPSFDGNGYGDYIFAWSGAWTTYLPANINVSTGRVCEGSPSAVTTLPVDATRVAVANRWDGSFVLAWSTYDGGGSYDVFAQHFDANGDSTTTRLTVKSGLPDNPGAVAVDMLNNGDCVVMWVQGDGVHAREYISSLGFFLGDLTVQLFGGGDQREPDLSHTLDGRWVMVWTTGDDVVARTIEPLTLVTSAGPAPAAGPRLRQNVPNPFADATRIDYALDAPADVVIRVYDPLGRLVASLPQGRRAGGTHSARWDGRDNSGSHVSSGTYFYELNAAGRVRAKKMLILR